jgi:2-polyprenyl-6-methoxyphenol hydroxylase-like FAD-dependent oxidoreductase
MQDIDVLIAGGGPVGLTASILLSRHGVRSLLVERHSGTAIVPKSRGINARTMEMYRQCGLEGPIRDAGLATERTGLIVWAESLAGREIERRVPGRATPANMAVTPTRNCLCAQDDLEPVLRRFAEDSKLGALRFSTELTAFSQDAGGVSGVLLDRAINTESVIRARYLIAADGAQSRVRRQLGVRMAGEERVYDSVNILFHADLRPWVEHRPAALYFIEQAGLRGTFLTINGTDRWGFLIHSLAQYGFKPEDFTPERCTRLVRQAAGVPDLPVSILGVSPWEASAIVADRYRDARVFLAGDAAHEMPPTGGFGLNTGVQDAHNLAWKLAAVLKGSADDSLLNSYHAERQPLAETITRASLANALSMGRTSRTTSAVLPRREFLNEQGLIFGITYTSDAVIPDGTPPVTVADPTTEYIANARPGSRAPHVWLQRGDERFSTIDLFRAHFTLLAASDGAAWVDAARRIAWPSWPPLLAYRIGADLSDPDDNWHTAYGIEPDGAVLVRPDGYVAWVGEGTHAGAADAHAQRGLSEALTKWFGPPAAILHSVGAASRRDRV